jgi:hypothetical protein
VGADAFVVVLDTRHVTVRGNFLTLNAGVAPTLARPWAGRASS